MSKLEKLIKELCPDGVEYVNLKEVSGTITTGRLNANAMVENGKYPFFTCDETPFRIDEYAFDTEAILVSGNGSKVGHINYCKGKFNAYQRTYVICNFKNIDVKFLIHYLKGYLREYIMIHSKKGSVPYITMPMIEKFSIPLPPLPVQREVGRILDNFTELTAELTAELIARKKQYEYYREKLLVFSEEIPKMQVGELFEFKNGINKSKEFFGKGTAIVNFSDVYNKTKLLASDLQGKVEITSSEYMRYSVKAGDVFFTRTSETKEDIGKTSILLEDIDNCVFSGFVLRARPKTKKLLPEYCAYCFNSYIVRQQIISRSSFTTRALTSGSILSKIEIPVPSLEKQKEIVGILNHFEVLVNDISAGLPAEIEARKQQYEYYREKLLIF